MFFSLEVVKAAILRRLHELESGLCICTRNLYHFYFQLLRNCTCLQSLSRASLLCIRTSVIKLILEDCACRICLSRKLPANKIPVAFLIRFASYFPPWRSYQHCRVLLTDSVKVQCFIRATSFQLFFKICLFMILPGGLNHVEQHTIRVR